MGDPFSIPPYFDLGSGELKTLERVGTGHINDTFLGSVSDASGRFTRYIFQRINQNVFPDVESLMENIARVTEHVKRRQSLRLVRAKDGAAFHRDAEGACWRAYPFMEGTVTVNVVSSPVQAREAGRAFGEFSSELADLPGARLHETIPDFHNTPKRFRDFLAAVDSDPCNRAASAKAEIKTAMAGADWAGVIADAMASGRVPERIAHNDAKMENVLLDAETGEAVCVVDLDTVMPGTVLHDFGDLVRTATVTAKEDERDLERVGFSMTIFKALAEGFLSGCGDVLTPGEIELLPFAGQLITYEQSLRFLSDYLLGDPYYKTQREDHNLDRTRNQLRIVGLLNEMRDKLSSSITHSYSSCS